MKAKLYKTEKENYVLVDPTKGTYDNGYMLGTSRESQYNKLSIKNCQAIERGYDLDELAEEYAEENAKDNNISYHNLYTPLEYAYKHGFQKALELMGDKKFSEEDMINAHYNAWIDRGEQITYPESRNKYFKSLQQTEWDCIILVDEKTNKPLLDNEGNLILKLR